MTEEENLCLFCSYTVRENSYKHLLCLFITCSEPVVSATMHRKQCEARNVKEAMQMCAQWRSEEDTQSHVSEREREEQCPEAEGKKQCLIIPLWMTCPLSSVCVCTERDTESPVSRFYVSSR